MNSLLQFQSEWESIIMAVANTDLFTLVTCCIKLGFSNGATPQTQNNKNNISASYLKIHYMAKRMWRAGQHTFM